MMRYVILVGTIVHLAMTWIGLAALFRKEYAKAAACFAFAASMKISIMELTR